MCVYNYEGTDYYFFSCSYGRHNDFKLYVATLDENGTFQECGSMDMPCMSEQISVSNDSISILFESCAGKYNGDDGADTVINDICYFDPAKLLSNCGVDTSCTVEDKSNI